MLISVDENWETDSVAMVRLISVMKMAGKVSSGRAFCFWGVFPAFAAVVSTVEEAIFLSSSADNKTSLGMEVGFEGNGMCRLSW